MALTFLCKGWLQGHFGSVCVGLGMCCEKFCATVVLMSSPAMSGGIFHTLKSYGVPHVFGVQGGFSGLSEDANWIELTHDLVQDIHNKPGSILANERGEARHADMAQMLFQRNCKQFFILGGDGAHKGALQLASPYPAVPCTVDNDLMMVDTSFGFDTACTEAWSGEL
ncbi:unnamed protein product [Cladocopium goreaui]|uniref:ATP-dependent 6-phosphofructokinase 4, chloroplastic (ATP-PFK 4) (Phosphofructokinase 4) (Phosphohexokinase 4) n=1 Tax=Cladocopium goreaui TaxID=2562237 RepID=A0A9P1BT58_9DINO|nr:unnamed protein product [Cladocopium goreaui]